MQIVEHTSQILRLRAKRGVWSCFGNAIILPFSLTFFLAGLVIFASGKTATLNCDRIESNKISCELISSSLFTKKITLIEELRGAILEVGNKSSDEKSYRIVLISDIGKITMTTGLSTNWTLTKSQNVSKINNFVKNQAKLSFKIKQKDRIVEYVLGGWFMLSGGGVFLGFGLPKQIVSCTFKKVYGKAKLKRKNVFLQSEVIEKSLDDIKAATVDQSGKVYNIKLLLKSGKLINLGAFKNRFELAKAINQFLEVNEQ